MSTDGWRGCRDATDVSLGAPRVTDGRDFYVSLRVYHCGYNKHLWKQEADAMQQLVDPLLILLWFFFVVFLTAYVFVKVLERLPLQGRWWSQEQDAEETSCLTRFCRLLSSGRKFCSGQLVVPQRISMFGQVFFFFSLWLITTRARTDLDDLGKVIDCYRTLAESHLTEVQMTSPLRNEY